MAWFWRRTIGASPASKACAGSDRSTPDAHLELRIWYIGLQSPDQHVERVRARVARGGHETPEEDIRRRFVRSIENLVRLLPKLSALRVFDNSAEGDPQAGHRPAPRLLLHMKHGKIVGPDLSELRRTPAWAKAVVAAALRIHQDD